MKFLILPLFLLLSNSAFTKSYTIQNIVELTNDLTARRNAVKDNDGNGCALIRVNIPSVNDIAFNSPIIGKPVFLPGEYNVYLPKNSPALSFIVDGQTYNIVFSDFNISLEEKKCYRVILSKAQSNSLQKNSTKIIANYDNAVVMIDGLPVGQTPLTLDNISKGKHVISVPNTIGVTMNDTTIEIKENSTITLSLHKEKRKPVLVDMATPGGDTADWYRVFGTNVKEENGKYGIVDYVGNILVPCEFDYVYPSIQNGYYHVNNNGKDGLYEPGKGLVVPCIYDAIGTKKSYSHDFYMPIRNNDKWGVMSPTGQIIVPLEFDRIPAFDNDAIRVVKESPNIKIYGSFSYNGKPLVSLKYKYLDMFINGYAFFEKFDNSIGFVDKKGKETILPPNYSIDTNDFWSGGYSGLDVGTIVMSGLFPVQDNKTKKWGYMDTNLNLVIPTIYDKAYSFDDSRITLLKQNNNKVIINNKGKIILDSEDCEYKDFGIRDLSYSNIGDYDPDPYGRNESTFIWVMNNDSLCGFLDANGNVVVPCRYNEDDIRGCVADGKNYFILEENDQLLVMDQKQEILCSLPSNLFISKIKDGFIMIRDPETNSYGYLNMKGEILANCIYGSDFDGSDGSDGSNDSQTSGDGYDITEIIDEQPISEGLAILNLGDRFGFIDNQGTIKVPLIYTAVTPFENGISYVRQLDGKWKKIYKKDL